MIVFYEGKSDTILHDFIYNYFWNFKQAISEYQTGFWENVMAHSAALLWGCEGFHVGAAVLLYFTET